MTHPTSPPAAYLLVLHGSHDARYQTAIAQLAEDLATHLAPIAPYRLAYLECSEMPLPAQIVDFGQTIAAQGIAQIQIVPLFLLPGVHVMEDLPTAVAAADQEFVTAGLPIELVVQDYLGSPDRDQTPWITQLATLFPDDETVTMRLVVAHGTKRSGGNQPIEDIACALQARTAYWFVAPSLSDEIAELAELGIRRVAILPYVLVEGALTAGIDQQIAELAKRFPRVRCDRLPALDRSGVLLRQILSRCQSGAVV
jgi:sirohydrochlorin cobaltochelatase